MIEARELSKRYGPVVAVDGLSFTVAAGQVTGFLGPNGSGESTKDADGRQSGRAARRERHRRRAQLPTGPFASRCTRSAPLDAGAVHPSRSARHHLAWLADSNALPRPHVDAVLEMVGLTDAAHRRVGAFSLGMRPRLDAFNKLDQVKTASYGCRLKNR